MTNDKKAKKSLAKSQHEKSYCGTTRSDFTVGPLSVYAERPPEEPWPKVLFL